jgi:hypothetical protein
MKLRLCPRAVIVKHEEDEVGGEPPSSNSPPGDKSALLRRNAPAWQSPSGGGRLLGKRAASELAAPAQNCISCTLTLKGMLA